MRNIIVVCLDTVRKDAFDTRAPRLVEYADTIFEQCRAASSWSVPSHASMVTGELPSRHGYHTYNRNMSTLDQKTTWLGELAIEGYQTLGVSANVFAGPDFGFDTLFDEFVAISPTRRFPQGIDPYTAFHESRGPMAILSEFNTALQHDHVFASLANLFAKFIYAGSRRLPIPTLLDHGARVAKRAGKQQLTTVDKPFVQFINVMDAHIPFWMVWGYDRMIADVSWLFSTQTKGVWDLMPVSNTKSSYLQHWRSLYHAAIDYLDRIISEYIDWVLSTHPQTTIIITADHGENLGTETDDHLVYHKSSLLEGVLHVPFILINPPTGYPNRVTKYTSHLELPQLVTALSHDEVIDITRTRIPAEVMGMSAGPEPPEDQPYWDRTIRCAYQETTKIIWDSLSEVDSYRLDRQHTSWQEQIDEMMTVPEWASSLFMDSIDAASQRISVN